MKAIQIAHTGGPESIHLVDLERPAPAPNQALVDTHVIGVNFIDIYYREGVYPSTLPLTLGQEAAGVVVGVGNDAEHFRVGDRVAWCTFLGAYAEYAVVPESHLVHVPARVTFEQAAASLLEGMTAEYLSTSTFPLKAGHIALVHAGAGGVGLLLTQMAAEAGAHVISTVSTREKAELLARLVRAMSSSTQKRILSRRSSELLAGVAWMWGTTRSARKPLSVLCSVCVPGDDGALCASSGAAPSIDPIQLSRGGSLFLTRPSLTHYTQSREELDARSAICLRRLSGKSLESAFIELSLWLKPRKRRKNCSPAGQPGSCY